MSLTNNQDRQEGGVSSTVTKNVQLQVANGGRYPFEVKQDVMDKMFVLGNISQVSLLTGVDRGVIQSWKKTDWWKEYMSSIRYDKGLEVDSTLTRVIDKAVALVEDRLENGDRVLNNKTGELIQKPVTMKDASIVARDLLMRQQALRHEDKVDVQQKETVKETLALLMKEFAKMGKSRDSGEVVDVEAKEVE